MLLHNQKGAAVRWEANGVVYEWEPYGSCEVPDQWLPFLRGQGFPVDVSPVPPQTKAEDTARAEREAFESGELTKLKAQLADATARSAESAKAAELAASRETKALDRVKESEAANRTLRDQLATARAEIAEHEKLLAESMARVTDLERQLEKQAAKPKTK
jgi:hypothetical protein